MAVIAPVAVAVGRGDGSALRVTWTPVTSADSCGPYGCADLADKSVQAIGTFDSATVAVHGSNDGGVTFAALNVPAGTPIGMTVAGIKAVLENTEQIKPVMSGGGGSQSLTIAMLIHQTNPLRT